jgi:hypothetical protein
MCQVLVVTLSCTPKAFSLQTQYSNNKTPMSKLDVLQDSSHCVLSIKLSNAFPVHHLSQLVIWVLETNSTLQKKGKLTPTTHHFYTTLLTTAQLRANVMKRDSS